MLEFLLSTTLRYLPTPIPRIISTDLIFPFKCMHTQYLYCIHPPTPFPHFLTLPLIPNPQAGPVPHSCSLILQKKKNDIFVYLR
jgi:hypothetical protein